ncbi:hypothetical protein C6380_17630 [Pseudomonas syringae pv. actinidiae]|uniref:hypothetical protein n=1 Tax=Pseudomonas syringae TaxID=317 RepID=UPI000BB5658A|nr:hypothetical protein [Pseudomonas syringae]PBK53831.1 hypothetical protein BUE60_11355 [Pseudomonas syringae pv. actinidiae]PBK55535.1 hypothetical protein BUE61_07325 [Pseudomonas syringae pv. actinidiae]RJX53989.1 hypothetical protein C6380_17630 [Pseudomonas syringae pv. actinidiae]RJX63535.1 hypothetical protein C6379_00315 [Pseudomonas syringae pv. actinidiae]RJX65180.1 hypothetical protein C6383_00030 [Pseudomonas syringae pv. actinidiae]
MSDLPYPASEDIISEYAEIDSLYSDEAIIEDGINKGLLERPTTAKARAKAQAIVFDPSIGRDQYVPATEAFTNFRPISAHRSIHELRVVRTEVYDDEDDRTYTLEVDPNDPEPLRHALRRLAADPRIDPLQKRGAEGTAKHFDKFATTGQISLIFESEMHSVLRENYLNPKVVMDRSRQHYDSVLDEVAHKAGDSSARSKEFCLMYPDFYDKFREYFLAVNNYRLTLTAVEKNRLFDPITKEPFPFGVKTGLTWNKLQGIAKQSAEEAFRRTKLHYEMANRQEKSKTAVQSANAKLEREIRDINKGARHDIGFLSNFLKQSGMKFRASLQGETSAGAVKRFRAEYRAFANKELDALEKRGLQMILAIASAKSLGKDTVGSVDMDRAAKVIQEARRVPGAYTSPKRMIYKIVGNDAELGNKLMLMLDGRRSFARNVDVVAKFGQSSSRVSRGDSRVKREDREEGKRFAASTFLRVLDKGENVAHAMIQEFKRSSNVVQAAVKVGSNLSNLSKRLLNQLMEPMSRDEAYRRSKVEVSIQQARPAGLTNDQGKAQGQGPERDGPGMKPRR